MQHHFSRSHSIRAPALEHWLRGALRSHPWASPMGNIPVSLLWGTGGWAGIRHTSRNWDLEISVYPGKYLAIISELPLSSFIFFFLLGTLTSRTQALLLHAPCFLRSLSHHPKLSRCSVFQVFPSSGSRSFAIFPATNQLFNAHIVFSTSNTAFLFSKMFMTSRYGFTQLFLTIF